MSRPQGAGSAANISPVRLRQIALVAKDLDKAEKLLTSVIGTEVVFRDPVVEQWGLKNILVPIGGDIIEVVAPFKDGTTAGRLISKRGDGGYMIIMQNGDAEKSKNYIVSKGLGKVIHEHKAEGSFSVQYHPKGIKGGMMPELSSHAITPSNKTPLQARFSPWHACGPDYESYSAAMERHGDLSLIGAILRLAPGDNDPESGSKQWEELFGVARSRDLLAFTNARMGFVPGRQGEPEGLVSITIGVKGQKKLDEIYQRAREQGLSGEYGGIDMIGVRWYFVHMGEPATGSKL
ncbi:hypothetical protein NA57DRAFT_47406 [Rhizodiscina lignyota]|uniref:Glyoxalase-like domain-containing protein n=1 Tax=Rhizodiscina lignyota TaxID=1504668 RepID=A0A9P4M427_9PEZI|nr:hypothetical protein NA57DRAFT_47406 [Rhizodiscina lignyota]